MPCDRYHWLRKDFISLETAKDFTNDAISFRTPLEDFRSTPCKLTLTSSDIWDRIGKQTKRNQTWPVVKASRKVPSHAVNAAFSRERGLGPKRVEAMQTRVRCEVIACRAGRKNSLPLPSRLVRMTSQLICVCSRAETARCRSKVSAGRMGEQEAGGICNSRRVFLPNRWLVRQSSLRKCRCALALRGRYSNAAQRMSTSAADLTGATGCLTTLRTAGQDMPNWTRHLGEHTEH
ncbi:hypothetical protein DPX16_4344 [Anabarilius grahami]|uniref:Uncharacterized protein n=1 Tax=Anabarilius grahami TaxID=495550 RepID=A0A3N0YSW8_ANAGA|nr:hypothetical protein DPX16_4344 [Anabarilius grahami]